MSLNLKKALNPNKLIKQINKSNKNIEKKINESNKHIEQQFKKAFGVKNKSKSSKSNSKSCNTLVSEESENIQSNEVNNEQVYDLDKESDNSDLEDSGQESSTDSEFEAIEPSENQLVLDSSQNNQLINLEKDLESNLDEELIILDNIEQKEDNCQVVNSESIETIKLTVQDIIQSIESNIEKSKKSENFEETIVVREHVHNIRESSSKFVIIREISGLDIHYKTFVVNQANNVYSCPLLPIVEETEFTSNMSEQTTSQLKSLMSKGYWDRKIGKVYRIKFICQVCGKVPCGFKGYRVHVVHGWAKNILNTLAKSLQVLQFALLVSGIPNGVSEIGKLALQSIDTLRGDIINSRLKDVSNESIDYIKQSICDSMNKEINLANHDTEIKYVPITSDYINGVRELFMAFGDNIPPRKSGLVCVTRAEDFECGWVCQGSNGISSECYRKFLHSEKLTSLIRYNFQ